jgi:hypothetical protein
MDGGQIESSRVLSSLHPADRASPLQPKNLTQTHIGFVLSFCWRDRRRASPAGQSIQLIQIHIGFVSSLDSSASQPSTPAGQSIHFTHINIGFVSSLLVRGMSRAESVKRRLPGRPSAESPDKTVINTRKRRYVIAITTSLVAMHV